MMVNSLSRAQDDRVVSVWVPLLCRTCSMPQPFSDTPHGRLVCATREKP